MQKIIYFLTALLILTSCQMIGRNNKNEKVARVHNKYLYRSDLTGLVPPGTSSTDSAAIVDRYIDHWIKQNIYLYEAETNGNLKLSDIQRKVDDYRNSMIIFTHESGFLDQMLDTVISHELLLEYYERHKHEFKLRNHIVKVNLIKLPSDAPDIQLVRRLIRSENKEDLLILEEYCINHAASYFLDQESWFVFNDILREVPANPSNQESFLRTNKYVEMNDNFFLYFLHIRDYRLEGTTSPLYYEIENLKAIILNHRKQAIINQFRQDLYLNAVKESAFEVYNSQAI
jgi:hypothetical protein